MSKNLEIEVTAAKRIPFHEMTTLIKSVDKGIQVKLGDGGRIYVILPLASADDIIDALAEKGVKVVPEKQH